MGYHLNAILVQLPTSAPEPLWLADSKIIALGHDICMIPVTDNLHDGLQHDGAVSTHPFPNFMLLSAALVDKLLELSVHGPVCYVQADYFGGIGGQRAVVWRDGKVVLGPLHRGRAINRALRVLGVKRQRLRDEFEVAGLNRHRNTEDWLNED